MTKPKALQWLEQETAQPIDYTPEAASQDRHLSVRLSDSLAGGLEELAGERNLTVSQLVRELLTEAVVRRRVDIGGDEQGETFRDGGASRSGSTFSMPRAQAGRDARRPGACLSARG